ncbi:Ribosomal RNA small subunit methyltransferase F [Symbiodinium microadriaticum]|uniref:Ribosomal RNA small subunit methyltransferase F n=1 Tax=Symbiodinium microadriaticum TaxID=2951 RepID=A0A1Q9EKG1_SYMMI|nr:Ribosomal RNA small subunit methyltransferase F [Symbiodinium microadriaticum]
MFRTQARAERSGETERNPQIKRDEMAQLSGEVTNSYERVPDRRSSASEIFGPDIKARKASRNFVSRVRRLLAHLCAAGGLGGCELRRLLRSCARPPQPALRVARRRAQRRLQGRLREEGFRLSPSPFSSDGFFVAAVDELNCQAPSLGRSLAHRRGEVYGQETTSTLPVEVLGAALRRHQISPEYVLDLCAAPGSKATQLVSQLPSGTVLMANEFREDRARLLRANLHRSGASRALVSSLDGRRFGELCPEAFDAILVDAPCSGEGNIRKDPKAFDRWDSVLAVPCTQGAHFFAIDPSELGDSPHHSLRLEASAPQRQMTNEEGEDLTHLEKLKANSAGGRMENVMKGSIDRFRSSTARRKQEVAQLEDHSDEENSPVAGERASNY